jgi:hypothetical protein
MTLMTGDVSNAWRDMMTRTLVSIFLIFFAGYGCIAQNDNISLQGKSVMYRMGGKIFYGRPLKNIAMEQQEIHATDSAAIMKVNKKDAFGNIMEKSLNPISDTNLALIEAHEADMKVRKKDVFGENQKDLQPIPVQKMTIIETKENAQMKVRAADAFGNISYENLSPITQRKVLLLDENEAVMRVTTTDAFGNFEFENLNPDGNYKIKLQMEENPDLAGDDLIYIANNKGEVLQTLQVGANKDFVFSTLSRDSINIKLMEAIEVEMEK